MIFKNISLYKKFSVKKVFITTPIFYVNSKPHIGHLYTAFLASAVKYVNILKNNSTNEEKLIPILSTGTDEHGLKVQQKAKELNIQPKILCDKNSKLFKVLFDQTINYDYYIRTSDDTHKNYVQKFWTRMLAEGLIQKCNYSGFYSVQDECFVPEKDLIKKDGKYYTSLSTHSNQQVEYLTEENYKIKFDQDLIEKYKLLIQKGKLNFIPKSLLNEINGYIGQNLNELCISRPAKRVQWGIKVPDDPDHVIYVWFEALLNYLTIAEEIYKTDHKEIEFIHIIGKDITKFHCYFWPLILLLTDYFPFKMTIIMHDHWLKNETKMSKSIGNVVDPEKMIKTYGLNALRYYFLSSGPQVNDVNFDEKFITKIFYKHIPDSFINLLLRMSNNKIININDFNKIDSFDENFIPKIKHLNKLVEASKFELVNYNFVLCAHQVHLIFNELNNILHTTEFWNNRNNIRLINQIMCLCVEFIRIATIILYPFLPELMLNVGKFIGINANEFDLDFCFFRVPKKMGNSNIYTESEINLLRLDDKQIKQFNNTVDNSGYFYFDFKYKDDIFIKKVK